MASQNSGNGSSSCASGGASGAVGLRLFTCGNWAEDSFVADTPYIVCLERSPLFFICFLCVSFASAIECAACVRASVGERCLSNFI